MSPRRYESPKRRAAVEVTRERILDAAHALVGGKGDLAQVSMELIAERAGVSRMTVYYQFRSKAKLLDALMDRMASRAGMARLRLVFGEPNPERALRGLFETFGRFWSMERAPIRRLRAMAVVDPREGTGARSRDAWRREAVTNLLRKFGETPDLAADTAVVDVITMLASFEAFDQLATGRRSADSVANQLASSALAVIADARRAGARHR